MPVSGVAEACNPHEGDGEPEAWSWQIISFTSLAVMAAVARRAAERAGWQDAAGAEAVAYNPSFLSPAADSSMYPRFQVTKNKKTPKGDGAEDQSYARVV